MASVLAVVEDVRCVYHDQEKECVCAQTIPGDVMHFSAFGRSVVVLNSKTAVFDLLEKRSAIYSDRPRSVLAGEM